jgi:hypothetical protein
VNEGRLGEMSALSLSDGPCLIKSKVSEVKLRFWSAWLRLLRMRDKGLDEWSDGC